MGPHKNVNRDKRPFGVKRTSDSLNPPFAFISKTMPTGNPIPPSNRPAAEPLGFRGGSGPDMKESSIEYVGRKESRVPLPMLFLGFAAVAAVIIAFVHFSRL